ncbi:unnamed protein product [Rotaria magnacalcarata]|uniref:EF-hand domain-containing protein n=1 Tax=Rotaria magnacalcarata TaxID=392030 RepID=A0A815T100_9BILA|nr:unnamed protein product [Rotaria magnacalcarata]CAF1534313.1 unnamed protein product [Rotaria magnacalcarata]CAF2007224.1 unnamed protein product [Rotaria magnacalcarata]CAF2126134.1 unnamed protein product [Rotaria magnacalcarata]CAF5119724.1 unnamed protein product [Rotaria magnacalcarata]
MSFTREIPKSKRKPTLKGKTLTEEQQLEYKQAFSLFDRDEDGLINPKELSYLIRSLECNPSDNEIQSLIDRVIDEGSSLIDCNQFLIMMSLLHKTRDKDKRRELHEIFTAIDTDNNGVIDSTELRTIMRLINSGVDDIKLTKEEIDEMIAEIDSDKDGRITFNEFARIFEGQI